MIIPALIVLPGSLVSARSSARPRQLGIAVAPRSWYNDVRSTAPVAALAFACSASHVACVGIARDDAQPSLLQRAWNRIGIALPGCEQPPRFRNTAGSPILPSVPISVGGAGRPVGGSPCAERSRAAAGAGRRARHSRSDRRLRRRCPARNCHRGRSTHSSAGWTTLALAYAGTWAAGRARAHRLIGGQRERNLVVEQAILVDRRERRERGLQRLRAAAADRACGNSRSGRR